MEQREKQAVESKATWHSRGVTFASPAVRNERIMKRALLYLRRSKKSDERTVSIETQQEALETYAKAKGLDVVASITHDGVSGRKRQRFDVIDHAIDAYRPDAVLIYYLDRFGRDSVGVMSSLRSLAAQGIEVIEVAGIGPVKVESAIDNLQTGLRTQIDEFLARVISEKTCDALRHLKSTGRRYSKTPPFGFSYANGTMVPNEDEAKALALIKECHANGYGARKTITLLEESGYYGRRSPALVHSLLWGSRVKPKHP